MIKKLVFLHTIIIATVASMLISGLGAAAINNNDLMDDVVFDNVNTMSAAQINTFINQFPSSCISSNNGFSTPDPQGWSQVKNSYVYGGNVTSGQAIYDAAHLYGVNPQVILTTLQKEQSVVTGAKGCHYDKPDPTDASQVFNCDLYNNGGSYNCTQACPWAYGGGCMNIAMSYGCPGNCNANDEGFSKQLTLGTWLLRFSEQRAYGRLTDYIGYETGDENFTYNGPMTAGWRQRTAGGASKYYDGTYTTSDGYGVTIANGATASLYTFTPFVSGNTSFDNLFQNSIANGGFGFGTVFGNYSWQILSQYAYTDQTKTVGKGTTNLLPGDRVYVGFTAKNTGNAPWYNNGNNPVMVGTLQPMDRNSPFCDSSWGYGCNRPALMQEAEVDPGQTATFEFWIKAPATVGTYQEHFGLLVGGISWMPDVGLTFSSSVVNPIYTWQMMDQYAYTDQTKTVGKGTTHLLPGDRVYVGFKAKNTGNVTWKNSGTNPVNVGMTHPLDRNSVFYDGSWLGQNRPARMIEASVAPGQIGTFEFWMDAPKTPGTYLEYFDLVAEGAAWMNDTGLNFYMSVDQPVYTWQFMDQYAYTDQTKTTGIGTINMTPGTHFYVGFKAKNTGNVTWKNSGTNPVNIGMTHPMDRLSVFFDGTWLGQNRPAHMTEASIAPGQTGTFEFWMNVPNTSGQTYREYFDLVAEGAAWMPDPGMNFYITTR